MNTLKSRILALVMLVAVLVSFALPTYAATQPSSYSSSSNSGERDVVCTTLNGTTAAGYYTGSYSYDSLASQSSSVLLQSLRTLMTSTHKRTTSYSDCKNYANVTDCENNSGKLVTLYTSYTTYYGGSINREHVWPKSLGGYETSGPGADLHHIRPTESQPNSDRSSLRYGNVTGGKTSIGNASGYEAGTYGSYFEPLDNVKGDVARICLYMYARYGGMSNYTCSNINKVFQSVDVLLDWCELDPVDTWEMGRNEVIYSIQGNRNVFIDYPELAWLVFGKSVPTDMPTPSGKASNGTAGGNTGSGGNTGDGGNTDTPVTEGPYVDPTPVVGTAYKFGMVQGNLDDTYYLAGGMDGYYMITTTDFDSGIDVYLESASGGYYLYTKSGSTKQYINMVVSADGQHVNGVYSSTASTVYTIDPTLKTVVATVDGAPYHFGTRNDKTYETVGPCAVKYNGFVCQFYTATKPTGCSHQTTTVVKNAVTPTCAQKGYTGDTYCAECNELLTSGQELPKNDNHTFGAWETAEDGTQTRECSTCGKVEGKTVNPADCKHENTVIKNEKPLCSEGAYTGDTCCADCGKLLVEGMTLPPMGHDFVDGRFITEPTDKTSGMQEQTCSYCGTVNVKVIPALKGNSGANVPLIAGISGGSVAVLVAVFFIIRKRIL